MFKIYLNQATAAESVLAKLTTAKAAGQKTHSVMLYAPTQSGKSGIMIAIMEGILDSSTKRNLGDNVKFVFAAPADSSLRSQLSSDLCEFAKSKNAPLGINLPNIVVHEKGKNPVYGTPTLKSLTYDLKRELGQCSGPTTLIVMIDEAHIATKANQQLDKALTDANLLTGKDILASFGTNELISNVFVVWVSATPWNYLEHYQKNNLSYERVSLIVDPGYVGAADIWGKMETCVSLEALADDIKDSARDAPSLTVLRVTDQKSISDLKGRLSSADFDIIELTATADNEINKRALRILDKCKISDDPALRDSGKSVVIVVKQMLGFGQRIGNADDHDLRIICEYSRRSTFDLVQGLFGRATGYAKNINNIRFFLGATPAIQKKYKFSNAHDFMRITKRDLLLQIERPFEVQTPTNGGGLKESKKSPGLYEHTYPLVIDYNPEGTDQQVLKDAWYALLAEKHVPADLRDDAKKYVGNIDYIVKIVEQNSESSAQIMKSPRPNNIGGEQIRASQNDMIAIGAHETLDVVMTHPRALHGGATSSSSMTVRCADDKEKGRIVYVVTFGLSKDILKKFKDISSITPAGARSQKHIQRASNV